MEAKGISQWIRHTANYIGKGFLEGNKKILSAYPEKFGMTSSVLSPFEAASHYINTEGATVTDSLAKTFLKDTSLHDLTDAAGKALLEKDGKTVKRGYDWAVNNIQGKKVVGGMVGIGLTAGVAGGLTHDTAGNIDIAGLPGI